MRVRFGACVFDLGARRLESARGPVALSPKAFELLAKLLERRPNAISKAELRDLLWPSTFVGSTSLARVVNEVRRAVGDDPGSQRFVATIRGFGYAFCGAALDLAASRAPQCVAPASCTVRWGSREIPLVEGDNLIGRAPECTVRIPSQRVSRHHARIVVESHRALIEDLGSKNGTFVAGHAIDAPATLKHGDEIRIDREELTFLAADLQGSTQTGSRR